MNIDDRRPTSHSEKFQMAISLQRIIRFTLYFALGHYDDRTCDAHVTRGWTCTFRKGGKLADLRTELQRNNETANMEK